MWVNITQVLGNPTPTSFWLYYGNAAATDDQDSAHVWDQYYAGVYHMNETGATTSCWDSTGNRYQSNAYYGTEVVSNPVTCTADNKFGNSTHFYGIGYSMGDVLDSSTSDLSIDTWGNITNNWQYPEFPSKMDWGAGIGYAVYMRPTDLRGYLSNGGATIIPTIASNFTSSVIKYFLFQRTGNDGYLAVVNLAKYGTNVAAGGSANNAANFHIGSGYYENAGLKGYIDELRVSIGIVRNNSWVNWSWYNVNKTDALNWSSVETYSVTSFPEIISIGTITNNTIGVCPCDAALCVSATMSNGSNMNISFYIRINGTPTFWCLELMINLSANTSYCFCLCAIYDSYNASHPMRYNTTYQWYYNVSKFNNDSAYNQSAIYTFTTAESNSSCESTASSSGEMSPAVGLIGLFGIIGYIFWLRRRRRND